MVMNEWRFEEAEKSRSLRVTPAMVCGRWALLRQWRSAGRGSPVTAVGCEEGCRGGAVCVLFADRFTGFSPLGPQEGWAAVCLFPSEDATAAGVGVLWRFYRLAGRVIPSSARRK